MIKYHDTYGWIYLVDKRIVARSKTEEGLKQKIKQKFGVSIQHMETGASSVLPKVVSEFSVKERFDFIEKFTTLCVKGVIPSLIITGSGGLGKTFTVLKTLEKLKLKEDTIGSVDGDFVFIKGYSTARNVYKTLYYNRTKVVIFDDCDASFKDPIGAAIFKAALDSGSRRIIDWGSDSKEESDVPPRFEFLGKVIFISNLEMYKFPQPIVSRSMLTDLTLSLEEKVDRIEFIFNEEKQYEEEDKTEVLEFIRKNMDKFKDLNVRSAFNALKMKVALGKGWERPTLYSVTLN